MNILKKRKYSQALFATLFMILGIALMFWPQDTQVILCYILGGFMILSGIGKIVFYFLIPSDIRVTTDFVFGIIYILLGVVSAAFSDALIAFYPYIVGFALIIIAAQKLGYSLELKNMSVKSWGVNLAEAIIPAVFGISLFVVGYLTTGLEAAYLTGGIFIFESILSIVFIMYLEHKVKTIKQELKSIAQNKAVK